MLRRNRSSLVVLALVLAASVFSGCNGGGFQKMEAGEHGVLFRSLPRFFGGGVASRVIQPGEMEFVFPWEKLYRLETSVQSISWGGMGQGDATRVEDHVETRAYDGNEVGLSMTVQYQLKPEKIPHLIQNVGATNDQIRSLVTAVARADIRTHMNMLRTKDFFSPKQRQAAILKVHEAISARLNNEGIEVTDVIYSDHRFERRLPDATLDKSYQEQIDRTQSLNQQTKQEENKIRTVVKQKELEFNDAQARVNRVIEEAQGYLQQSKHRGDGYLQAKSNEATQILTVGTAEVEGLRKEIAALSGPGGAQILKLAISKALVEQNPKFILLNSSGGQGGIDFTKVDANELLRQFGIAASANEALKVEPTK